MPFHLSSQQQRTFNCRLSSARAFVENAYGWLKEKWQRLLKWLDVNVRYVPVLVAACCILHNICEIHGERFDQGWMECATPPGTPPVTPPPAARTPPRATATIVPYPTPHCQQARARPRAHVSHHYVQLFFHIQYYESHNFLNNAT